MYETQKIIIGLTGFSLICVIASHLENVSPFEQNLSTGM